MRLEPFSQDTMPNPVAGGATLDSVLSLNARRRPRAEALVDSRLPFPGTWAEVDRAVTALASTFASWKLGEDAVVGVQLGSSFEGALTCLALWRAGLIAAMLPTAWRRRETARALGAVKASAIVTLSEGGGARLAEIACEVAAGLETMRYVGCFGAAPDGATRLDDCLLKRADASHARRPGAADHVAVVTFEVGGAPAPRSHNDLVAAGVGPLLVAEVTEKARLFSTLDLASLAGLCTGLAPWLTTGAVACFHEATTTAAFAAAATGLRATHVVLPGRIADKLAADGALGRATPSTVLAVWRAPEGRGVAKPVPLEGATVVDVLLIGELAVLASPRPAPNRHAPLPLGPHAVGGLDPLVDLRVLQDGRLFVRGPACPQAAFPSEPGEPALPFSADGYIETGLAGIADRAAGRTALGGLRRGVAMVGGLAISMADATAAARGTGLRGALVVEDDPVFGLRFALKAADGSDPSVEAAGLALDLAGFGPALAPVAIRAESARRTA
jgi:acyl-CoA synthetase (AMP-forming)/AMP-acid ligase II